MNPAILPYVKTKQRIFHERIHYLYQGGLRAVGFNVINSVLLVGVYWSQLSPTQLLSWLILLTLVSLIRMTYISKTLAKGWEFSKDQKQLLLFRAGALTTGTIWGGGFTILSPALNETYTVLFLFALAGMSSGAFSSMTSDRTSYLMYILPMLIPAMLATVLQDNLLGYVMTIMLVLFTGMLTISHKLAFKTFIAGFEHRFAHEDLVKELTISNKALTITNKELERTKEELKKLSLYDELTKVPNRRHFTQVLEHEIKRARRDQTPLAAIMIDVDAFKNYNDAYGHAKGDQCLHTIADHLQKSLSRSSDFLARYGGEEFVALLPNTTQENALILAERMRTSIFNANLVHRENSFGRVTISAGVSCCSPSPDLKSCQSLIETADRSLYQAKEEGRNRVVIHTPGSVTV
ncbi:MAG: GGDEF domain-containing protein [Candidatus Thiodiazotropha sp.]